MEQRVFCDRKSAFYAIAIKNISFADEEIFSKYQEINSANGGMAYEYCECSQFRKLY